MAFTDHKKSLADKFAARYVLCVCAFSCFFCQYLLRTNLSVAIVTMVHSRSAPSTVSVGSDECKTEDDLVLYNYTETENISNTEVEEFQSTAEFDWDEEMQGVILGSFFWGYVLPQVFGGRLAERYGTKHLFGGGLAIAAVFSLLSPLAARTHSSFLIVCRVIVGIAEGVMAPAFHSMLAKWAPITERSRMTTIAYSGQIVGSVLSMALAGLLCEYGFDGGWPTVFYVFGGFSLCCSALWYFLVHETPQTHPRITERERMHISKSISEATSQSRHKAVPWKRMLTSKVVWAGIVGQFGFSWGHYTLLTQLPTYMKSVLGFDVKTNGFLSSLPYLMFAVVGYLTSFISDRIIKKKILTVTTARKVFQTLNSCVPALCYIAVTLSGCDVILVVVWLVMAGGFYGTLWAGIGVNQVDIAPNYAGTLLGIGNTIGTCAGVIAPYVVGALCQGNQSSRGPWNTVFYITATIHVVTGVVFVLFGSGEEQSWNRSTSKADVYQNGTTKEPSSVTIPLKSAENFS